MFNIEHLHSIFITVQVAWFIQYLVYLSFNTAYTAHTLIYFAVNAIQVKQFADYEIAKQGCQKPRILYNTNARLLNNIRPVIQQRIQDRNEARNKGIPLGEHRQRILLEAAQRNMNTITPAKCAAWYRFMQTYIPRCLNHENIDG